MSSKYIYRNDVESEKIRKEIQKKREEEKINAINKAIENAKKAGRDASFYEYLLNKYQPKQSKPKPPKQEPEEYKKIFTGVDTNKSFYIPEEEKIKVYKNDEGYVVGVDDPIQKQSYATKPVREEYIREFEKERYGVIDYNKQVEVINKRIENERKGTLTVAEPPKTIFEKYRREGDMELFSASRLRQEGKVVPAYFKEASGQSKIFFSDTVESFINTAKDHKNLAITAGVFLLTKNPTAAKAVSTGFALYTPFYAMNEIKNIGEGNKRIGQTAGEILAFGAQYKALSGIQKAIFPTKITGKGYITSKKSTFVGEGKLYGEKVKTVIVQKNNIQTTYIRRGNNLEKIISEINPKDIFKNEIINNKIVIQPKKPQILSELTNEIQLKKITTLEPAKIYSSQKSNNLKVNSYIEDIYTRKIVVTPRVSKTFEIRPEGKELTNFKIESPEIEFGLNKKKLKDSVDITLTKESVILNMVREPKSFYRKKLIQRRGEANFIYEKKPVISELTQKLKLNKKGTLIGSPNKFNVYEPKPTLTIEPITKIKNKNDLLFNFNIPEKYPATSLIFPIIKEKNKVIINTSKPTNRNLLKLNLDINKLYNTNIFKPNLDINYETNTNTKKTQIPYIKPRETSKPKKIPDKQNFETIFPIPTIRIPSMTPPDIPDIPPPPPPQIPNIILPKVPFSKSKYKQKRIKIKSRYNPSVTGVLFNIKTPKLKSKKTILTGFELRGV